MLIDINCPVEFRGYEITIDKKKELTSCALKLFNLADKEIDSVELCLQCFDPFGEPVGDLKTNKVNHILQDLNARGKTFFGDNKPIPLSDHPTTRTVRVTINRVKFTDGEVWAQGEYDLIDISTEKLTGKALEEMRALVGEDAICYAHKTSDYLQCVCGRANHLESSKCIRCGRVFEELFVYAISAELVKNKLNVINSLKVEKAKQVEIECKKQSEIDALKRKALFNKNLKVLIPIAIVIILAFAICFHLELIKPQPPYIKDLKANMESVDKSFDQIVEHLNNIESMTMTSYTLWGEQLIALTEELDQLIEEAKTLEPTAEHEDIHELYLSAVDLFSRANYFMRIAVYNSDTPLIFQIYNRIAIERIEEGWRLYHKVQDMLSALD